MCIYIHDICMYIYIYIYGVSSEFTVVVFQKRLLAAMPQFHHFHLWINGVSNDD